MKQVQGQGADLGCSWVKVKGISALGSASEWCSESRAPRLSPLPPQWLALWPPGDQLFTGQVHEHAGSQWPHVGPATPVPVEQIAVPQHAAHGPARSLDILTHQGPVGLRICSTQLPSFCVASRVTHVPPTLWGSVLTALWSGWSPLQGHKPRGSELALRPQAFCPFVALFSAPVPGRLGLMRGCGPGGILGAVLLVLAPQCVGGGGDADGAHHCCHY